MIAQEVKLQLLATFITLATLIKLAMAAPVAPEITLNPRDGGTDAGCGPECNNGKGQCRKSPKITCC